MIVVDASALLEVLLRTPNASAIESRLFENRQSLHAAHLLDVEVASALRGDGRNVAQARPRGRHDFLAFNIRRYDLVLPRAWALRRNVTVFDAVYVSLAEALDAPLFRDRRLAGAAGHHARIELV